MNKQRTQGKNETTQEQKHSLTIENYFLGDSLDTRIVQEVFVTQSSNYGRGTAETSWTLSGSNRTLATLRQTPKFAWVNSASAISTGSWSSPSVRNFTVCRDGQTKATIDALHLVPTNGEFIKRINDRNTFIKEQNFRTNKDQVGGQTCNNRPSNSLHGFDPISVTQGESRNDKSRHIDGPCVNKTTSRSKDIQISHPHIVSYQNGVAR